MRKSIFTMLLCWFFCSVGVATEADSVRVEQLEEITVNGVRVGRDAPFTISNITKQALNNHTKTGRELPMLLSQLPGIIAWSDNGVGIGTSYLRIRGTGDSRINVTIDGVALNSPEDQCVFWANMNSYSAFLNSIQVQRGVGTSTNGDGAFGGNIALESTLPSITPTIELTASYGSYNSFTGGVTFSTGLLKSKWAADVAYHHTRTDGFMDGTAGYSGSAYAALAWLGGNITIRYRNIFNYERMGQAWNGVDTGNLLDGNYGVVTNLNSYKDFYKIGLGRYNNLYERLIDNEDGNYEMVRYELADGTFWKQTTDNFWQDKSLLSVAWAISDQLRTSLTLHYTYGYGYYKEFKYNTNLSKFGLNNYTLKNGEILSKTDFVRKKGLTQHTFGAVYNINYTLEKWNMIGGISIQDFRGTHFGYLTYVKNHELWTALGNYSYKYYDSNANKLDANIYAKATYHITSYWVAYADIQYRHVTYTTSGVNDKFVETADGYANQVLDINKKYNFFNPKMGFSYTKKHHHAYASVALSHREPERNNFTDNGSYPAPHAERLIDTELGYTYNNTIWRVEATLYYMKYKNQFVQTGELSDIGEALTTNIKDSFRAGIELSGEVNVTQWLTMRANIALSKNCIKDFNEMVEDWDNGTQIIHYDNSTLAFSPSLIGNFFVIIHTKGFSSVWHTNLVSRQYLDNTTCKERSLPAYTQSDVTLSYAFNIRSSVLSVGVNLNNVFNAHYTASGWVYSAICESSGYSNENRYREIGYYPMAGRNVMFNININY